jgi:XTP/dITP diphosphohydrolase
VKHALLVATGNAGKLSEFRSLFADLDLDVLGPKDVFKAPPIVVEDGITFVANATKKARAYADASAMLCLADDSGLEVDALGGSPGVRSARFAHERATDAENRAALSAALEELDVGDAISIRNVGAADFAARSGAVFTARFRCALVLVDPFSDAATHVAEGTCEGSILRAARGNGGFGYDPLFLVDGERRTMAELSPEEKNRVSHRGRALVAMRPRLIEALEARTRRIVALFAPR